ncbi:hypothetical protein E2C01_079277 [Portunus trituberculatus]|uniref:Uncharacterized protein n=1 Tax=Portunus trituberculatus TaxID=210409 RepID=A0A5B7ISW9_PORTR|nr:hypothetical protein [Portunus trituberculatus]
MGLPPRLVLPALSHRVSLLEGFARDQTAPESWAVSSRTLILFVLIAGISAAQGTRVSPAASVLSDVHGGLEISFQDVGVLSQDELIAGDLGSQQGTKPPVAIDLSLFLKSWQEEVLASVNSLVASQIGDLRGSVPPPPLLTPLFQLCPHIRTRT